MQVAITGASGLIGTALSRSLRADGHQVRPLVRPGTGRSDDADAIRWDPQDGSIDAAALEGVDAVVHLAGAGIGEGRWTAKRKRLILESRTKGTGLIARTLAGLKRPPKVLLSASGVNAYGDGGDKVLTETSPPGEGFLAGVVAAWEQAAQPAVEAGIRTAFTRNGLVLSREGGGLKPLLRLFRLGLGGRLGSGRQWMSWISLADEVGALRFLIDHDDIAGPVNLAAPDPVTNRDFTRALGRALGRPRLLPIPRFGPRLVLGEMADELLFCSLRVEPAVLEAAGYQFAHSELDGALAAVLAGEVDR
ncbi:MAG: TIGR01777 family oxidoreductase [Acidimicrobiales bacterium]